MLVICEHVIEILLCFYWIPDAIVLRDRIYEEKTEPREEDYFRLYIWKI